ncbi:MAG TPA: SDR family oxidoreductase [Terriglobia bacterium]|nr:SDR family oxidoreductase [Terriglobia bacterium]
MDDKAGLGIYDFRGRTVVVTGGTGILGWKMAESLIQAGANVAIVARNKDKANSLISGVSGPGRACAVQADVLKRDTLQRAKDGVLSEFGRLDALINSAGGNHPQATTSASLSLFDLPEEALRMAIDLNILGTILPCQIFAKQMAEQGEGVILNVSSMSSFRPMTRVVGYSAAKAAINNFTQWLAVHMAREYSPRIRVNAIAPGFFLTEQNRYLLFEKETGKHTERARAILDHTPMRRFGEPEDLIGAVQWLLSPASAFVTGIVVPVDGGFSAFAGV